MGSLFAAVALLAAVTSVRAGSPRPVIPVNESHLDHHAVVYVSELADGAVNTRFNATAAGWTAAVNLSWSTSLEGWWMADYDVIDREFLRRNPAGAYLAVGFAQGYAEAPLLWEQWDRVSSRTYDRIVLGRNASAVDRFKGTLFAPMLENFLLSAHDKDATSYVSTVANVHDLVRGRSNGFGAALSASTDSQAPWLPRDAQPLSIKKLFFMMVESELLAAETAARILTSSNVTFATYTPWMSAPAADGAAWTDATAPRFASGSCVAKRVAHDNVLLARVADGPFDVSLRRVMRNMHVDSFISTTGTAGDLGASGWHANEKVMACGAPIQAVNPYAFANVAADVSTRRPSALSTLWALFTADSASDFARKLTANVLGIDATAWLIADIAAAADVVAADVVPGGISARTVLESGTNGTQGLWVAGGRPVTASVQNAFNVAGRAPNCSWCASAAYAYVYNPTAAANFAPVTTVEQMLRQVRATSTNWQAAPPRPAAPLSVTNCAGIAPSPRFDLNDGLSRDANSAEVLYVDRACARMAYGAIEATVASSLTLRAGNTTFVAIMGPTYEAAETPAFDPNRWNCGQNDTQSAAYASCVAGLGFAHGPIEFAPIAVTRDISRPDEHPNGSSLTDRASVRLLICFATMAAVFLIFGGFCLATRPLPVEAPPSTARSIASLRRGYAPLSS